MKSTTSDNKKKALPVKKVAGAVKNTKKLLPAKKLISAPKVVKKAAPNKEAIKVKAKHQSLQLPQGKKDINPFPVVAIGASAGGLEAVTQLLQFLPANTGMAFIYVQHLSPDHKSMLTSILSKITAMKVQEIDDMEKIEPDNVYIIPYNKEIEVIDGHIQLLPRPQNKSSNLSIDVLFSSLAETHKENVIGIVLSGSASDGTRGLEEIKLAGGITFAQDDSAKFSSMPQSAIASGAVDFILSPKEIAKELAWMSKHPLVKRTAIKPVPEDEIENSDPGLNTILQILYKRKNVDFSHYKMSTIKRRMLRRMLILKVKTLEQYATLLMEKKQETDILFQDLLINVTDFFRDAEAFAALKKTVFPKLLKSKAKVEPLRIWVAACATGEEVYSLAITLLEMQQNKLIKIPFQIFASDLSAEAIAAARIGEYSLTQLKNISPRRLQQFFTKSNDTYRISKSLRDVCVFAEHNILRDPPFSHMDFISCRNMLIYLDAAAQKKVITTFHYSLNEGGCLMLGKSETIGNAEQLFTILNKSFKIYLRKKNSGTQRIPAMVPRFSQTFTGPPETPEPKKNFTGSIQKKNIASNHGNVGNAFDTYLLHRFMPASVVINQHMDILEFRGSTELYLKHSSGKASFNILKMAHDEITFELRNAIHNAIKTKKAAYKTGIEMNSTRAGEVVRIINIEVAPLIIEGDEPLLAIVFSEQQQIEIISDPLKARKNISIAKDRRIKKLEEELADARSDMGAITHDQEAANEELQSANEEIVSSNEELQSLNEELETSKEEIESTNEELTTSNHELQARIQQVEELYNYYEGILTTVQEPMLILDKDIRIKSANKSFCKIFHVTEEESIGLSLYKLGNNQWNIPRLRELLEDIVPKNIRFHNFEVEHTFPVIGKKIMLLNAHRVIQQSQNEELIVLTIIDITDVRNLAMQLELKEKKALEKELELEKKALKKIEDSNKRYNMMLMQSPFAFAVLKGKGMLISLANDSIKEIWGKGRDIEAKPLIEVIPELKGGPILKLLNKVYSTGIPFHGYEMLVPLKRNGVLKDAYFNFVYQPYLEADESISGVTIIATEVTDHVIAKIDLIEAKKQAEHKTDIAEVAVKSKQQFLSNMSHEIRTPMNAIIGFTNVVMKTKLNEKQREYLNAIKVSGESLIVLINDILDMAKIDAGKVTFENIPFYFFSSVSDMLHLFETKMQEKKLVLVKQYDTSIPGLLAGDPLRLRQIIVNLIGNAVKFTNKGKITVSIKKLEEDSQNIIIEFAITDTGIGIPKNKLSYIFDAFQQEALETNRLFGGAGLGLAIVKQMVELQGGTVSVKSKVDKGSTFSFRLSFKKTTTHTAIETVKRAPASQKYLSNKKNGNNRKVLIVEDVPLNQLLIKVIVEGFGFAADMAENGTMAIDCLEKNKYDIILMDLQMPVMNGFELTTYIRNVMNSQIPIIALTADVTTVNEEICKSFGMNDYISKPVDEKILYTKMKQYL